MLGYSELGRQENPNTLDRRCLVVNSMREERLFRLICQEKPVKKYRYVSQYKYARIFVCGHHLFRLEANSFPRARKLQGKLLAAIKGTTTKALEIFLVAAKSPDFAAD